MSTTCLQKGLNMYFILTLDLFFDCSCLVYSLQFTLPSLLIYEEWIIVYFILKNCLLWWLQFILLVLHYPLFSIICLYIFYYYYFSLLIYLFLMCHWLLWFHAMHVSQCLRLHVVPFVTFWVRPVNKTGFPFGSCDISRLTHCSQCLMKIPSDRNVACL